MKRIDKEKIQTWFVTGASSGVGREICIQLLNRGYNVVAVSRRLPQFDCKNALCLSCDVTDAASVANAVNRGIEYFGKIDVASNNAGLTSVLSFEEETYEDVRKIMETNFWGTYNVLKVLIPHFRQNGHGTVVNNTSQSGIAPRLFGTSYCSSKHAIEGLTSSLWFETQKFCRVMAFELGYFPETNIAKELPKSNMHFDAYKDLPPFYLKFKRNFQNDLKIAIGFLIDEVEKERIPRRLMLGKDAIIQIGAEIKYLRKDWRASKGRALKCAIKKKK